MSKPIATEKRCWCRVCGVDLGLYRTKQKHYCSHLCAIAPKVEKVASGCHLFRGSLDPWGYGIIRHDGVTRRVHRLTYESKFGPIPDGMLGCHKCDTPACCNPDHIFPGTDADNYADMIAKGRDNRPKGEANARAKLKDGDVVSIRRLHEDGVSIRSMAAQFGVSQTAVWLVVHGRAWKHVA